MQLRIGLLLIVIGWTSLGFSSVRGQTPATDPYTAPRQVIPFAAMLFYEEARSLLKVGKREEATAKLRRAVQEFPDFLQARIDLAQELLNRRQLNEALEIVEGARRVSDQDPRVYRLFGLIMLEQGKWKMAEYGFRQAIERAPAVVHNYQGHGLALVELAFAQDTPEGARANWLTQAEQQLLKSLELSQGKLVFSHLHLARIYEMRGEKLKAAQELETFLQKNPQGANEKMIREAVAKLRKSEK